MSPFLTEGLLLSPEYPTCDLERDIEIRSPCISTIKQVYRQSRRCITAISLSWLARETLFMRCIKVLCASIPMQENVSFASPFTYVLKFSNGVCNMILTLRRYFHAKTSFCHHSFLINLLWKRRFVPIAIVIKLAFLTGIDVLMICNIQKALLAVYFTAKHGITNGSWFCVYGCFCS